MNKKTARFFQKMHPGARGRGRPLLPGSKKERPPAACATAKGLLIHGHMERRESAASAPLMHPVRFRG